MTYLESFSEQRLIVERRSLIIPQMLVQLVFAYFRMIFSAVRDDIEQPTLSISFVGRPRAIEVIKHGHPFLQLVQFL
jgi:hypothetical protein